MEFLAAVLGALVGGAATGGATYFEAARRQRVERRVAARLILGDLFVVEAAVELILKAHHWPDRMDLQRALDTWTEVRTAFAADVEAWEWALVDGCFSNLHRTLPMVRLGESTTDDDESVLNHLCQAAAAAQKVVEPHTAKPSERDKTVKILQARQHTSEETS